VNLRGWLGTSVALVALAAAASTAGCSKLSGDKDEGKGTGSAAPSGSGATVKQETGPIKIGHYASLTGSEATFGVSTDQGIKLAIEERNAAGGVKGRKVELLTEDTASQAAQGGTAVTKLINSDRVVALIGEVSSSITLQGGDVAQKLGVPDISPSSTNVHVTEIGDMVSRVCFTDDFQAWVVAKFLRDDLKLDKVAIMYDQGQAYSKGLAEYFKKSFTELGGKIVANEAYSSNNPDASAQLTTIKNAGAQAVFLPGYYGDAANYMKQAKSKGIKIPFVGGDGWDSSELLKIAGESANGNYFSNHYSHEEKRPEVQSFVANYEKRWGAKPDGLAALGYDAARVLFDAMERAPSLNGKDLAAAINSTKDFAGVTGSITIDAKRNAQKKAVILKIENGAPHLVTDIWPPGVEPPKPDPKLEQKTDVSGSAAGAGSGSAAMGGPANQQQAADPSVGAANGGAKEEAAKKDSADEGKAKGAPRKAPSPAPDKADPDEGGE
jgi:branched-chain amino acid transport system substrate-binding protein